MEKSPKWIILLFFSSVSFKTIFEDEKKKTDEKYTRKQGYLTENENCKRKHVPSNNQIPLFVCVTRMRIFFNSWNSFCYWKARRKIRWQTQKTSKHVDENPDRWMAREFLFFVFFFIFSDFVSTYIFISH